MRYALLLYLDREAAARTTPEEADAELAAYGEITRELAESGLLRGGEALMPARTAIVVGVQDGRRLTAAGADELELSGFYIIECDEQHAVDVAARMPVATHGAVEVRPVMDMPEPLSE